MRPANGGFSPIRRFPRTPRCSFLSLSTAQFLAPFKASYPSVNIMTDSLNTKNATGPCATSAPPRNHSAAPRMKPRTPRRKQRTTTPPSSAVLRRTRLRADHDARPCSAGRHRIAGRSRPPGRAGMIGAILHATFLSCSLSKWKRPVSGAPDSASVIPIGSVIEVFEIGGARRIAHGSNHPWKRAGSRRFALLPWSRRFVNLRG